MWVFSVVSEDLPWYPVVRIVRGPDVFPVIGVVVPVRRTGINPVIPSPLQKPVPKVPKGVVGAEG